MSAIYFLNVDLINETPPLEKQRICMNAERIQYGYFNASQATWASNLSQPTLCLSEGKKKF